MSIYYIEQFPFSGELYHHGIKGQKWGVRRFDSYSAKQRLLRSRRAYSTDSSNNRLKGSISSTSSSSQATKPLKYVNEDRSSQIQEALEKMRRGSAKSISSSVASGQEFVKDSSISSTKKTVSKKSKSKRKKKLHGKVRVKDLKIAGNSATTKEGINFLSKYGLK